MSVERSDRAGAAARALEHERDLLLRSLDQLDQEYAAGDLDQGDYQELAEGYTARAAGVMRRITSREPASSESDGGNRSRWRVRLVGAGLLAFAIGSGFALAQASGERGVRDQITGGIDTSARERVATCQQLGSTGGDLVGALECFDAVLIEDPENVEALSYRGWYLLLAAGSLQQSAGDQADLEDVDELTAAGLSYLDRAIAIDDRYPDPLAFRASVYDRLGRSEQACADIETLRSLDPPQFFIDQTAGIADRNGC